MIILVEGPNRVGKSTFINEFVKLFPRYASRRCDPISKYNAKFHEINRFWSDWFEELATSETPTIWDRSHISELVYTPRFRPHLLQGTYPYRLADTANTLPTKQIVIVAHIRARYPDIMRPDTEETGLDLEYERKQFDHVMTYHNGLPTFEVFTQMNGAWVDSRTVVLEFYNELTQHGVKV